jgi:hypothetical protein
MDIEYSTIYWIALANLIVCTCSFRPEFLGCFFFDRTTVLGRWGTGTHCSTITTHAKQYARGSRRKETLYLASPLTQPCSPWPALSLSALWSNATGTPCNASWLGLHTSVARRFLAWLGSRFALSFSWNSSDIASGLYNNRTCLMPLSLDFMLQVG